MKVLIASDHAGFALKESLKKLKFEWQDLGPSSEERVDYPDFAKKLSNHLVKEGLEFGVLICGSGQGMAMAANKVKGIRAALAWNEEIAELSRSHNNANVLCLPSRFIDMATAENIVEVFLNTKFSGERHEIRVKKIEEEIC